MRRALIWLMWQTCSVLDWIPTWERDEAGQRVRCHGAFGCGLTKLGYRAMLLEDRWSVNT